MYVFHSTSLSNLCIDEFVTIWNETSVDKMDGGRYIRNEEDGEECIYDAWLFNRNVFKNDTSLSGMYGALINDAESSVFLCPYLPTADSSMMESIRSAVERESTSKYGALSTPEATPPPAEPTQSRNSSVKQASRIMTFPRTRRAVSFRCST